MVFVGPLGFEPRLFGTKNQRVTSYTIGQSRNEDANLKQIFIQANIFLIKYDLKLNVNLKTVTITI